MKNEILEVERFCGYFGGDHVTDPARFDGVRYTAKSLEYSDVYKGFGATPGVASKQVALAVECGERHYWDEGCTTPSAWVCSVDCSKHRLRIHDTAADATLDAPGCAGRRISWC